MTATLPSLALLDDCGRRPYRGRSKVTPSSPSIMAWMKPRARLLEQLKQSTKLFADETTAPVLDPWARARQEGPVVGLCGRRAALGRPRSAKRCLRLCP